MEVGVRLVLDDEDPLVGCMASGSRATLVREEQHVRGGGISQSAWHQVTVAFSESCGRNEYNGRGLRGESGVY